ncbi:hypothetical protein PENSTE_c013G08080 [Penicillium steckii]|uniref:DUF4246 domain-containing protein n=1 Tax=Penicillium steckii TaxID=303698 RepID=A0A1V6T2E5_9EURO|nr:hypothetical protein PENSTE_c013G08080 [Penicillium steckii]
MSVSTSTNPSFLQMPGFNVALNETPKVFDERITSKWRVEIEKSGQDISLKMMDWVIQELQWKAGILNRTDSINVFDNGVFKSDTVIPKELQQALKDASMDLSDVSDEEKDYHHNSEGKVVDLVHPSLYPVIYGRTRVLPDRIIGLDDSIESMGLGSIIPAPNDDRIKMFTGNRRRKVGIPIFSKNFQWLPCDVEFTDDGCKIVSYINNLHPEKHKGLYEVIEKIISKTIPLWNESLEGKPFRANRIRYKKVEYDEHPEPEPEHPGQHWDADSPEWDTFDEDAWGELYDEWEATRPILQPEPGKFEPKEHWEDDKVDLRRDFPGQRLQVIVKMANIELTPDNPEYDGGSWHIEGQLNERIAASAIYYYDNENITPSTLSFRQRGGSDFYDTSYDQSRHEFLQVVYGFDEPSQFGDQNITQELGGVNCREGRIITFPNTLQHRVSPFTLSDPSKPGHRKILALFLVDPHRRIISSANVPPQRDDWLRESMKGKIGNKLMSLEEAKDVRLELMAERSLKSVEMNQKFEVGAFNLCEH